MVAGAWRGPQAGQVLHRRSSCVATRAAASRSRAHCGQSEAVRGEMRGGWRRDGGRERWPSSAGQADVSPLEDLAPEHAGGQAYEDLTGAVDHPRRHVDQPASDELEVVRLDAFGSGVTEIFLLDCIGDPFA